ncbi:hypothetical protein [Aquifex aeolicus]|uniref:hypothetical protein n=1 Tax=Aquifex aeolicus TaxID=63363 RepID=UPI00031EAB7A|nr:hypothetical protein [Aquifex aeolicus]
MDIRKTEVSLIKKRWENIKSKNGEERKKELMILLRMIYPLIADSRGREVLELYTKLKGSDEALKEAEGFLEEVIRSLE